MPIVPSRVANSARVQGGGSGSQSWADPAHKTRLMTDVSKPMQHWAEWVPMRPKSGSPAQGSRRCITKLC
jgi:hypothetical protein